MGETTRNVKNEDLSQMPFCDAVITEALRLFPPVPFIVRQADRTLEFGMFHSCTQKSLSAKFTSKRVSIFYNVG